MYFLKTHKTLRAVGLASQSRSILTLSLSRPPLTATLTNSLFSHKINFLADNTITALSSSPTTAMMLFPPFLQVFYVVILNFMSHSDRLHANLAEHRGLGETVQRRRQAQWQKLLLGCKHQLNVVFVWSKAPKSVLFKVQREFMPLKDYDPKVFYITLKSDNNLFQSLYLTYLVKMILNCQGFLRVIFTIPPSQYCLLQRILFKYTGCLF